MSTGPSYGPRQASFDELGTPLRETTFVVVDLETTGGSPADCEITEIGAVKVRAGEVLGEFQTLVRPRSSIPPFISVLTGITDSLVAGAPTIDQALPAFLEFAHGTVWVAHNAPFDLGFLRAACASQGLDWPAPSCLDTARIARRVLSRDETPNCKLASLARLFRTSTAPCHRALADARATVDVLHGLIARLGGLGVHTVEELAGFTTAVPTAVRAKRTLADGLPHSPGVYLFRDAQGRALYVGKSKDLRTRVRSYFTSSEQRARMAEMVTVAARVDVVITATDLEADVRELRLISEHQPRYNRRSRRQADPVFVKLTVEPFPRLAVVRRVVDDGAAYLGPFGSRQAAGWAVAAVHEVLPLRQCTARLSPRRPTPACVLAELHRCGAPCDGSQDVADYASHVALARAWFAGSPHELLARATASLDRLAGRARYEEAALLRDRVAAFVQAADRGQRLAALAGVGELAAARRLPDAASWEVHLVRHGRLAASGVASARGGVRPLVAALQQCGEVVEPGPGPVPRASAEEMTAVLRWLHSDGVRLVASSAGWASPAHGASSAGRWLQEGFRDSARPFADGRSMRTTTRPVRRDLAG